ncbi:CLC_0170 family protein [Paenibacillus macerans]|uniref:CLC_0170 family protein n=1 Tax=Paenibacillus macerans TaxID=44252 RepID=UPI003D31D12A
MFSGLILLLVDNRVYQVQQMLKEQKYARISGWIQLSLAAAVFWPPCYSGCSLLPKLGYGAAWFRMVY